MRQVIYAINVSLDGFIEDSDGGIGWSEPSEALHRYFNDLERELDTHLYGRRMYETMLYWRADYSQHSSAAHELEYAALWQGSANVVFSRTLEQVSAPDRLVRGDAVEEVRRLKALPGKAMGVGGPGLAAALLQADLVDEVRLAVHPVILGGGKPVFPTLTHPLKLRLIDSRPFDGGVLVLRYGRGELVAGG